MTSMDSNVLIILDDREFTGDAIAPVVGSRRFGDIVLKRQPLIEHFLASMPAWAKDRLVHLRTEHDLNGLKAALEASPPGIGVCIIAARSGFTQPERLTQLVERLPYAAEDFTDRIFKPLIVFLRNGHQLIKWWQEFKDGPVHLWHHDWLHSQRLQSTLPLDLSDIGDFLSFTRGATATRHFNRVTIDNYYYTKISSDRRKMRAEYSFYGLVPESMRPWLIQPFAFEEDEQQASYKMMRYYLADAALQWVHGAFSESAFRSFVERLLFFVSERPRRGCRVEESLAVADELFKGKVANRVDQLSSMEEGRRINAIASSTSPGMDVRYLFERYTRIYDTHRKRFASDYLAVGHGDPCFSNILYEQQRHLLKLIDPKGALTEEELWTHPIYDLCKISHSALGDYDFINNGMYSVTFSDANDLVLVLKHTNQALQKPIFLEQVASHGHDPLAMRIGEASLFISMLPLHIDYPNKVIAFMLRAKQILDEIENEHVD